MRDKQTPNTQTHTRTRIGASMKKMPQNPTHWGPIQSCMRKQRLLGPSARVCTVCARKQMLNTPSHNLRKQFLIARQANAKHTLRRIRRLLIQKIWCEHEGNAPHPHKLGADSMLQKKAKTRDRVRVCAQIAHEKKCPTCTNITYGCNFWLRDKQTPNTHTYWTPADPEDLRAENTHTHSTVFFVASLIFFLHDGVPENCYLFFAPFAIWTPKHRVPIIP